MVIAIVESQVKPAAIPQSRTSSTSSQSSALSQGTKRKVPEWLSASQGRVANKAKKKNPF